jgi:gas vesicle protein
MHRYEDETAGGSFLLGLLAGVVLGAGVGLLFAPRPGAETRRRVSESANRVKSQATEGYTKASERVSDIVDRGRESYDRVRGSVSRGIDEVRRHAHDAASSASQFVTRVADTVEDEAAARRS